MRAIRTLCSTRFAHSTRSLSFGPSFSGLVGKISQKGESRMKKIDTYVNAKIHTHIYILVYIQIDLYIYMHL